MVDNREIKSWIQYDTEMDEYFVKLESPINIALVKYWGKVHDEMIIPANNSLSLTINKAELCSRTTLTLFSMKGAPPFLLKLNGQV